MMGHWLVLVLGVVTLDPVVVMLRSEDASVGGPKLKRAGSMACSTCLLNLSPVSIRKMMGTRLSAFSADCIRLKYSRMTRSVATSTSALTVT